MRQRFSLIFASVLLLLPAISQSQSSTPPSTSTPPSQAATQAGPMTTDDQIKALQAQLDALKAQQKPVPTNPAAGSATSPAPATVTGAAPADPVVQSKSTTKMVPGWVVNVFQSPADLITLPPDSLGSFIANGSTLTTLLHLKQTQIPNNENVAYELQGFYQVTSPGRHSFVLYTSELQRSGISDNNNCSTKLFVEDSEIAASSGRVNSKNTLSAVGGAELSPGLYRLRITNACRQLAENQIKIFAKRPDQQQSTLIPDEEILHSVE